MSSFKGQYKFTLDAKGRLNIPAKFRKALTPEANDSFVIVRGMDNCLFAYPLDEWKEKEKRLRNLSSTQAGNRRFIRMLTANASESQFDKQGRIAIPSNLIELAGIEKEILIIGTLDKLELWNPNTFEKYLDDSPDTFESLAEEIIFD